YVREEDLPLAVNSLKRARELQSHPVVAMNLGILRYLQGDQDGDLLLLDEEDKSSGGHGLVQYMRSRVLQALGRTQESSEALAEAVRMGIDPEKLKNDDPRGWTQYIFSPLLPPARERHPPGHQHLGRPSRLRGITRLLITTTTRRH